MGGSDVIRTHKPVKRAQTGGEKRSHVILMMTDRAGRYYSKPANVDTPKTL
jgi:hypothetical protein